MNKYWRVVNYILNGFERTVYIDYTYADEANMKSWKNDLVCSYMKSNKYDSITTKCDEITEYEYRHQEGYYVEEFIYQIDGTFYSLYDILVMANADGRRPASNDDVEDYLKSKYKKVFAWSIRDLTAKAKERLLSMLNDKTEEQSSTETITNPWGSYLPCGYASTTNNYIAPEDYTLLYNAEENYDPEK